MSIAVQFEFEYEVSCTQNGQTLPCQAYDTRNNWRVLEYSAALTSYTMLSVVVNLDQLLENNNNKLSVYLL